MALTEIEKKVIAAVDELGKCVVVIRNLQGVQHTPYGNVPIGGSGSGFIIDSNGNVVTNFHVIANAKQVEVILRDGRIFNGAVVGGDKATDIALIKIEGTNLPVAKLGDSEKLKVGQMALAIGNALDLPGAPTASMGVISALGRPLPWADFISEGLIQSDAAINPGNSGGPLADLDGNVVGINTAIVPYAQGVGFSIPINTVKMIIEQILEKGRVIRPMLGVLVANLNPMIMQRFGIRSAEGALVTTVTVGSPAQKAGMRELDVITRIGKYQIKNTKDLMVALSKLGIGESVEVKFTRNNAEQSTRLVLAETKG
jgi:serine protease Do